MRLWRSSELPRYKLRYLNFSCVFSYGVSWSEDLVLSEDGFSWDIGYPSTAQLNDGTLVTLRYLFRDSTGLASLRCMGWRMA